MEEMNIALLALLEGCLPEELSLKHCTHCGVIFELEADYHETLCKKCKDKIESLAKQPVNKAH